MLSKKQMLRIQLWYGISGISSIWLSNEYLIKLTFFAEIAYLSGEGGDRESARLGPVSAEKNQVYVFVISVLRKIRILWREEEKGRRKKETFLFISSSCLYWNFWLSVFPFTWKKEKGDDFFNSISAQTLTVAYTM